MTAPRPGDQFDLEIDGMALVGRYLEVEPPYRLVIGWDRPGSDRAPLPPATTEITLTPTTVGTLVRVQFSDLSDEEAALYSQLWARYLHRIAAVVGGDSGAGS